MDGEIQPLAIPPSVTKIESNLLNKFVSERVKSTLTHVFSGHRQEMTSLLEHLDTNPNDVHIFQQQKRLKPTPEYTVLRVGSNPPKIVKARFGSSNESYLIREADWTRALPLLLPQESTLKVPDVYEVYQAKNTTAIIMENVEGKALPEVPDEKAQEAITQIFEALSTVAVPKEVKGQMTEIREKYINDFDKMCKFLLLASIGDRALKQIDIARLSTIFKERILDFQPDDIRFVHADLQTKNMYLLSDERPAIIDLANAHWGLKFHDAVWTSNFLASDRPTLKEEFDRGQFGEMTEDNLSKLKTMKMYSHVMLLGLSTLTRNAQMKSIALDNLSMDEAQQPNSQEIDVRHDVHTDNDDTVNRLRSWEAERPLFTRFSERKARHIIVEAAIADIQTPLVATTSEVSPQQQILALTSEARARIDALIPQNTGPNVPQEYTVQNVDSVTKEPFITRFRREAGGTLIAEEVRPHGETFDVISQARITPDGRTELTLNFTGTRYEAEHTKKSRNPKIIVDSKFPRATATTFNLLAGTVKKA